MPDEGSSNWQEQLAPQTDYTTTAGNLDDTMTTAGDFFYFDEVADEDPDAQGSTSNAESECPYVCMHRDEKKNKMCGKAYRRQCDLT